MKAVTQASRRRLILLTVARVRAAETVGLAMRLVEDLVRVSNFDALTHPKAADPVLCVRKIIDTLVQLQGRIETEIGKVPHHMTVIHDYRVGDLVQTEYNDGPGAGTVYGLITSAGPKRCGVTWESGRRQILHKDRWHLVKRVPDDAREDALHATRRARSETLAKITAKQLAKRAR